jgi:hypothetical protein
LAAVVVIAGICGQPFRRQLQQQNVVNDRGADTARPRRQAHACHLETLMSRNLLNYIIDTLLLIVVLGILGTGLLIRYQLPPGSRGGHGLESWGWNRHSWGDLHFWLAVAAVALFVLHVAVHWDWVVAVTQRQVLRQKAPQQKSSTARQNAWGVLFLLLLAALVGGWLWLAEAHVYLRRR